jgi:hypothetical protein
LYDRRLIDFGGRFISGLVNLIWNVDLSACQPRSMLNTDIRKYHFLKSSHHKIKRMFKSRTTGYARAIKANIHEVAGLTYAER